MICRSVKVLLFGLCLGMGASIFGQATTGVRPDGQLPEIDFCNVLRNPKGFIGKTIVVKTIYSVGFEMGWLEYPPSCDIPDGHRFAIRDVWDKQFDKRSDAKVAKRFHKIAKTRNKKNNYVGRVAGSFEIYVREFEKTNPNDVRFQYDFVVMRVLAAEKVKK